MYSFARNLSSFRILCTRDCACQTVIVLQNPPAEQCVSCTVCVALTSFWFAFPREQEVEYSSSTLFNHLCALLPHAIYRRAIVSGFVISVGGLTMVRHCL